MSDKKSILITGANGLLGKRALLEFRDDYDVHAIVRTIPDQVIDKVTYHAVDMSKTLPLNDLPQNLDSIFHLAQSSRFREFPAQAMDIFQLNIASTATLLDFARQTGVKRFVYASSGGVYGSGAHAFHENSPLGDRNALGYYLGSKLCGEIMSETYTQVMTIGILRFFFMYGPEQNRTMLIPRLVDNVRNGVSIPLLGQNGISINPVHVSDAAVALKKMMDIKESRTLNIAGNDTFSIRQIAEMIGDIVGKSPVFAKGEGTPQNLVADISAMKAHLSEPKIHLSAGLRELV